MARAALVSDIADAATARMERDRIIASAQEVCGLTEDEVIIYAALFDAAERGAPCPTGEDLNDLTGRSSDSASRNVVERLAEQKGLIRRDKTNQRFRKIQIVATGKWTAASEDQRSNGVHMPRGVHDVGPLLRAMTNLGKALGEVVGDDPSQLAWEAWGREVIGEVETGNPVTETLKGLLRFENLVDRVKELIVRRKMHFLITPGGE